MRDNTPTLEEEDRFAIASLLQCHPQRDGRVIARYRLPTGWRAELRKDEEIRWLNESKTPTTKEIERGFILHEQGRFAELLPMLDEFLELAEWAGEGTTAAVAWFCADIGDLERAEHFFERIGPALGNMRRDEGWMIALYYASLAAAELQDRRVSELYSLYRPFARQPVVHQRGRIFVGSSSLALARLAAAQREEDVAVRHFEEALEHNEALGARAALARTHFHFARFLEDRREPSRKRAASHLERAGTLAAELDMRGLLARMPAKGRRSR